ncbi:MAG: epoxyqueuosine reductase [Desulfovibrio sp.]|jgi:epoxyqueuosine reductase QueG|nr:epoxyqueuosine reductase [Desulfovibrio sp.]
MDDVYSPFPWLDELLTGGADTVRCGFADMRRHRDRPGDLPFALSLMVRMDDGIMDSIANGPTRPYFEEYTRVNRLIDDLGASVVGRIEGLGYRARQVPASATANREKLTASFSHKQAATQAGLGWIGRNCQLVSREFGPRIRLGTVFTDLPPVAAAGAAITKSFCGKCDICVKSCPAGALSGKSWSPGMLREELFDAVVCNTWKNRQFAHLADGSKGLCGICVSRCPRGKAARRKVTRADNC